MSRGRPKRNDGYTLIEALCGMAIIGLAAAGFLSVMQSLAAQQLTTNARIQASRSARDAEMRLARLFDAQAPFRQNDSAPLTGAPDRFEFSCGLNQSCGAEIEATGGGVLKVNSPGGRVARIALHTPTAAEFRYRHIDGEMASWPPAGPGRRRLEAIAIVIKAPVEQVLVQVPLWREHGPNCVFDVILRDCR